MIADQRVCAADKLEGDNQNVFKKGNQSQSVFPLDQMCKLILSVITPEIC
jgi:hypothetical protein